MYPTREFPTDDTNWCGVTTAMPTHDGLGFKKIGMMMVSMVYKHKPHGTTWVLPSSRSPEENPYMMLVVCIDYEVTKSSRLAAV
jgi:hypothetical protein